MESNIPGKQFVYCVIVNTSVLVSCSEHCCTFTEQFCSILLLTFISNFPWQNETFSKAKITKNVQTNQNCLQKKEEISVFFKSVSGIVPLQCAIYRKQVLHRTIQTSSLDQLSVTEIQTTLWQCQKKILPAFYCI